LEVPITQALQKNENSFVDATDYRGEKVLAVTKYIDCADWGMVVKIDSAEVLATFYEANIIQLGVVIIFSGILASLSLIISDQILKPISILKKFVRQLEQGNYETEMKIKGNNEITSLAYAFEHLQKTLSKNEKVTKSFQRRLQTKLRERNELKKAIDQSSSVTMTNKRGKITYVNNTFCKISGYSHKELLGKSHDLLNSGYHPDSFWKNLWETVSKGEVWQGNIKNKAKDGSYFWLKTTITPLFDDTDNVLQYIAIWSDITKQKAIEENLAYVLEDLRDAEKQKEEFSTMISHELKTPLTPIKFNTEMLLEPEVLGTLNEDQSNSVNEIVINANRLENLISDMLYAQKMDLNKMIFNKKKFSTDDLIEQITKNLSPLMQEKEIKFETEISYSGDLVSDKDRIQQTIENLVKNSVDFVPEKGGKISIGIQGSEEYVTFCVKDNGIGIPKEKIKNLFKKFYQVDTSHTRKHGGTGLGLVIAKGFVEGLGGKIWCESKFGKGTAFFFTIPNKQEIQVSVQ
jgi:PAS domain S-box-containing protein